MDDLARILAAVVAKLWTTIRSDAELRSDLRKLGHLLLSVTEADVEEVKDGAAVSTRDAEGVSTKPVAAETATKPAAIETKPPTDRLTDFDPSLIKIGSLAKNGPTPSDVVARTTPPSPNTDVLPLIEKRCGLKAEASRWAAQRQQLLDDGGDFQTEVEPQDKDLISRAKAVKDCFLWMSHPASCPNVDSLSEFEDLAACYDVVVSAAQLLRRLLANREDAEELLGPVMQSAAEAQSMLQVAVMEIGSKHDTDQLVLFHFLKSLAFEEQVLITRHMKIDDPADPSKWNDALARIDEFDSRFDEAHGSKKKRRSRFNKIRYHLKSIREKPQDNHVHDWQKVVNEVHLIVTDGLPPSSIEFRGLLADLIDGIPERVEIPDGAQLVIREIDRYLSSRPVQSDAPCLERPSEEIRRVVALLDGQAILMIGGENRPHANRRLRETFRLSELIWLKTSEQNPRLDCEPEVSRPDVALVLLAIRWSRHSFDDVQVLCEKHGKPLVRLPAGYNPSQVAEQIISQCSKRLAAKKK